MNDLTDARQQIATAISGTGLVCEPYAPDSPTAPVGWVDNLVVDYELSTSFCLRGTVTGTVVVIAQRYDRAGGTEGLEDLVPLILEAINAVDGVRVTALESGSVEVSGTTLPSLLITVQFGITS